MAFLCKSQKYNQLIFIADLQLFFDLQEPAAPTPRPRQETSVESDLKRYRSEVTVSLDVSPFAWWTKMGSMYRTLLRLAPLYHCVPCSVNMSFKKPMREQIAEYQRRHMLTGNLIDAILFLHHNHKISSV